MSGMACAEEYPAAPEFTKDDRLLILAPHPDDEVIAVGGLIQKALRSGAKVKVAYFTNGDHNEFAFIVYEKRLTLRKGEFLHMGEVRRGESIAAMKSLGLAESDMAFLGYPDAGTMEIMTKYWGNTKPFKSMLTRISKVSYPEAMSPGAPYVGESILADIKRLLLDFKPTKVFVSHPADTNPDHLSLYLFLHVALWDLGGRIANPDIFTYLVHVVGWPVPRGYHPDLDLEPPEGLKATDWRLAPLSDGELGKKHDAISFCKSQIEYNPPYLYSFARRTELLGSCPVVILKRQTGESPDWQAMDIDTRTMSLISYARQDGMLCVKIMLNRKMDKSFSIAVTLLGYRKGTDFASMPKIRAFIGAAGLKMMDKKKAIPAHGSQVASEGGTVILKIPFSVLGNPDRIMARVRARANDLSLDDTAWRVMEME
jgi:LmbE family N-acetylglucosaminyl deacetylase